MKVLLTLMITTLMITACGTSPIKSASAKVDSVAVQRKYASQVESAFVGETKVEACPTQKVIDTEKSWKSLMAKANGCINKSQWSVVESIGEKLSQVEPEAPWGAYYLSIAAENKDHTERAMWMIDLALKKANNVGILKYQKGRILWKQQFYKEAIAEMQEAVELDKSIKDAHLFLGQVYLRELDFKKAQAYFETVLLLESRNHQALFGLASCYIELENSKEAIAVIDRGISNFPKVLDFRLQEAYVYENLIKEPVVALEKYKQLQTMVTTKKVDGTLPFDINEKIKNLEEITLKTRQLASKKS
jgi:tetratricopeptide (TPR) repeat protein